MLEPSAGRFPGCRGGSSHLGLWSSEPGGRLVDEAAREYLLGFAGSIPPLDYEILNPQVRMYGDTAIFTFQMDVLDPESGAVVGQWMTTEIHERVGDGWEMVHAHRSNPAPAE